ncbi:MAG: prepilin peptidase [Candidatus Babeliales bacterium]|nr:prepilin peptidase [Candidatus Babeliales bacterium]
MKILILNQMNELNIYFFIPFFLIWGSFLNVIAYRLVNDISFRKHRSFCTKCNKILSWYDLIPIVSWLFLKGKCRYCQQTISCLYPFIEILSAIIFYLLFLNISYPYSISYFVFFSALIITIRTDIETMLISRFVTLFLIPSAFIFSILDLLPISLMQVLFGIIFGYFLLFVISKIFLLLTKKEGIGQGDIELLALIGAFTGIIGCWISLLIGSILGSFFGLFLILFKKLNFQTRIPFGPFLALGSIIYVLYQDLILYLIFGI